MDRLYAASLARPTACRYRHQICNFSPIYRFESATHVRIILRPLICHVQHVLIVLDGEGVQPWPASLSTDNARGEQGCTPSCWNARPKLNSTSSRPSEFDFRRSR